MNEGYDKNRLENKRNRKRYPVADAEKINCNEVL
jgi:hypothetical protein